MTDRTTFTRTVLTCPACDQPIAATFVAELHLRDTDDGPPAVADLTVVGMNVRHDCVPRTTGTRGTEGAGDGSH